MSVRDMDGFGFGLDFDAGAAVLGVRGDVDVATVATLDAIVGVLIDHGHPTVVLDLEAVSFMGAAGIGAIADASTRLRASGGVLAIRSASALVRQLLDITGVGAMVEIEASRQGVGLLGTEQRSGDHSLAVESGSSSLASDLVRRGSMADRTKLADAALRLVTALASATVEGADGVSISLEREGRLVTVASSNDTVRRMDDHQYETGEGPCVTAAAEGRWFHIESLADEERWPAFVPHAIEEGIASILSTPLVTGDRPVGALNIYSNTGRGFGTRSQELAALFATQASGMLADAGATTGDEEMATRIADALLAREAIAQAQGVLMARGCSTADDAAAALHRSARTAQRPVRSQAEAVLASTRVAPEGDG